MGSHPNIGLNKFPKQGMYIGQRVRVAFNYNTSRTIGGEVVRDDYEAPFVTIIKLDDENYVLATECQYTLD